MALIRYHMENMDDISPPGTSYSLDVDGLDNPDITMFGAYDNDVLMAIVALKQMTTDTAEIKSMRTLPQYTRQGLGEMLLRHVIAQARRRNYAALYLETGTDALFDSAVRLYRKHGFVETEVFGTYVPNPANQFFVLDLQTSSPAQ